MHDTLYVNTISVLSVNNDLDDEDDWYEILDLKGKKIILKLDSGAQCNVLPLQSIKNLDIPIVPSPIRRIASYSDSSFKLPVLGEIKIAATFCSRPKAKFLLTFLVVAENVTPILGRKACVYCGFLRRINTVQLQSWDDIRNTFQSLLSGLGFAPAYPYDAVLVKNPKLNIYPARRIPYQLQEPVKAELDFMERLQVIKPIHERTPAVSPMVIIEKGGKLKIGIDPSDLNKNLKRHHHPLKNGRRNSCQGGWLTLFYRFGLLQGLLADPSHGAHPKIAYFLHTLGQILLLTFTIRNSLGARNFSKNHVVTFLGPAKR